jgi:hypothetical protein
MQWLAANDPKGLRIVAAVVDGMIAGVLRKRRQSDH